MNNFIFVIVGWRRVEVDGAMVYENRKVLDSGEVIPCKNIY
jgi:hypothetical protein